MVSWNEAKGKKVTAGAGGGQNRDIERLKLELGDNKIRLVGEVLPRYCYWVTTNEGKKMPVECLQFDRETETFDKNAQDPFTEIDEDIYSEKPGFAYVCNVIDRKDGKVKLLDLRATIYGQIVEFAMDSDYGNPAAEAEGYDINIKKEKTGNLPQNVKYTCVPGRGNSPLTEEEKAMELFDLSKLIKRPTYEEQKKWLLDNTSYFAGDVGDEFKAPDEEIDELA